MSSTYRVLCLSHDPAIVAADGDWNRPGDAEAAIAAGIEGHETCDFLIGRYSYPLIEVGCPAMPRDPRDGQHRCFAHGGTRWVDVAWLRVLAMAQQSGGAFGSLLGDSVLRCWSPERLRRLRLELAQPEALGGP